MADAAELARQEKVARAKAIVRLWRVAPASRPRLGVSPPDEALCRPALAASALF